MDHRVVPPSDRVDKGNKSSAEGTIKHEEESKEVKEKTQDTIAALGVRAYVVYADLEDMADVKSVWGRALGLLGKEGGGQVRF